MSILRIFPGANNKEARLNGLLKYIVASEDKKCWMGMSFSNHPHMIHGYGIPETATLDEISDAFILPHIAYGYPGTRLCYHCLIDFNGLLSASDAGFIAWEINKFLMPYSVQFLQGVHVTKESGMVLWPHTHILINTIMLAGQNVGKKFRMEKPVLYSYKKHMNHVLRRYGLPTIPVYERRPDHGVTYTENGF
ncbi:hypothetical protein KL86SPO_50347 [uncultured Sporomusa sp.]|uniref:Uncharacterized protein n=1 Tax=uncultured Sporomusa sp. TaxID=307249 RepID=A0A212LYI1_9FIRM|nr:hypothetical protein [uncultured Sporomusa sp.]SCM82576.1 hypothetical protein KL86SPO_50347 [uncultured Sporomusa sp.]